MALAPRVITVAEVPLNPAEEEIRLKITTSARDKPLLQVNRESRQVALKTLVPIFSHVDAKNPNPVYFDYSKDALCIKQRTDAHMSTPLFELTGFQTQNEMTPIQNIIIGPDFSTWWGPKFWFRLQTLSSLKRVALNEDFALHLRDYCSSHLDLFDKLWKVNLRRNLGLRERIAKFTGSVTFFSKRYFDAIENGSKLWPL